MKIKVMLKAKNPHTLKSDSIVFMIDDDKFEELERKHKLDDSEYILTDIDFSKDGRKGLLSPGQAKRADRFITGCYNYLGVYNLSLHRL